MRLKTQRRVIYAATALAVLSLIGGYAVADFSTGSTVSTTAQGSSTTNIGQIPGLSPDGTYLVMAESNATGNCVSTACDVSTTSITICAGGIQTTTCPNQWVEQIAFFTTASTPFGGIVKLQVYVTSEGQVYSGPVELVKDSAGNMQVYFFLDFNIENSVTNGTLPVTSVSVTANLV